MATLLMAYRLKKKNKRIEVLCYKEQDDLIFCINTKRLIDFKNRDILVRNTVYTLDSALIIRDLLTQMTNEPVFKKISNPMVHQLQKEKYKASKYIHQ
jgi:hypothetical protein